MKNNQVNKNSKSVSLPPVRVGAETKAKLIAMSKDGKKSQSTIIRELIDNGVVKVIFDGKEVMRRVAEAQREFNQYSLTMAADIQSVRNDINQIKVYMQNYGIESDMFHMYLEKALLSLDELQRRYNERKTICTRVLPTKEW